MASTPLWTRWLERLRTGGLRAALAAALQKPIRVINREPMSAAARLGDDLSAVAEALRGIQARLAALESAEGGHRLAHPEEVLRRDRGLAADLGVISSDLTAVAATTHRLDVRLHQAEARGDRLEVEMARLDQFQITLERHARSLIALAELHAFAPPARAQCRSARLRKSASRSHRGARGRARQAGRPSRHQAGEHLSCRGRAGKDPGFRVTHGPDSPNVYEPEIAPGQKFWPFTWSGTRLPGIAITEIGGVSSVTEYDVTTRQYRTVTTAYTTVAVPRWLRDGRRFLIRHAAGIDLVDSATGDRRTLTAVHGYMIGPSLSVSADNTWYSYTETGTEGDLWIARLRRECTPAPRTSGPFRRRQEVSTARAMTSRPAWRVSVADGHPRAPALRRASGSGPARRL